MRNTLVPDRSGWATYAAAARAGVGMSQSELARKLGVDRVTIWRWEKRGQRPDDPEIARKFAEALDLDLDEVLTAAGFTPGQAPAEPTRDPDPELEAILRSGLPTRIQEELIADVMQRREEDQQRRLSDLRRAIRLAGGKTA